MSERAPTAVDIRPWINRAKRDPLAYAERQATEVVLTAIGGMPNFGKHIFLKGGILMAVVYESPRNTVDLDFTTNLIASPDFGDRLRGELDPALLRAVTQLGYADLVLRVQTVRERPRPFGNPGPSFPALDVKIAYTRRGRGERRLADGQAPHVIDVEVSFNEPVHAIQIVQLGQDGGTFSAYSLTDLIAEKFRALLQQVVRNQHRQQRIYRRQDVYDIAYLIERFPFDADERAALLASFVDKCVARDVSPTIDSMSDPLVAQRARAEWGTLQQEVGELPNFDACFVKVEALYRSLPWRLN